MYRQVFMRRLSKLISLNESMSIMHRVSENVPLLYMNRIKTINVSARDTVNSPFKTLIPNRRA